jgi:vacuolar-type H+-ATPase subunit B/Vma2
VGKNRMQVSMQSVRFFCRILNQVGELERWNLTTNLSTAPSITNVIKIRPAVHEVFRNY